MRASSPTFADWSETDTALENLAAYSPTALNLTDKSVPERPRGLRVSAECLEVFRLRPVLGRGLRPEEDQPGNDKVIIPGFGKGVLEVPLISSVARFGSAALGASRLFDGID